jgi:DNA-3-methyladenine glycosylase II
MTTHTPHSFLKKDPIFKKLIEQHGELDFDDDIRDIFTELVSHIIGQQLSGKAADTIEGRFRKLLHTKKPYSPTEILSLDDESVRAAGLSYSKIKYIKGLAKAVVNGELDLTIVNELSDEEVIVHLTKIKGIGRWTAEMTLMFTLKRPDVFSLGDNGLVSAISKLYGIDKKDIKAVEKISEKWKPYRTYAARYLWKSLDNQ